MHNATVQKLIHDSPVIAFFGAAGLFCCALLIFVAVPQWRMFKERLERVEHYGRYISSSDGFDAIRLKLESKNELLKSKLDGISTEMPPRSVSDILQELIRHSKECGIVLSKIQPQPETKQGNNANVSVFLETKADYHKLGKYVALLEASPQILQIRKIAIETAKDGELNAKLLVDCLIAAEGDN